MNRLWWAALFFAGPWLAPPAAALAQPWDPNPAECRAMRDRLAEHAQLSEGVRRSVASRAAALRPRPTAPPAAAGAPGRAEAIQARQAQIAQEQRQLEDERLSAYISLEFGRAAQVAKRMEALGAENAALEKELASLQPGRPGLAAPPGASAPGSVSGLERIPCHEMPAALDDAVKTRRRELGAREDQPGVIPLLPLAGQSPDQIARELREQFAGWPEAAAQLGLLDQGGKGRLEAFVDAPAPDTFRLYRQRADGTLSVDVFTVPGRPGDPTYGEMARRLEEATVRHTGRGLADLLGRRPAGPVRILGETADFAKARALLMAGNYAEASRLEGGATRTREFKNLRGETLRVVDMIAPVADGVLIRRVVAAPGPNSEEQWEEITTLVRPVSYWRTEVEVRRATERRSAAGVALARPAAAAPVTFGLDR